MSSDDSPNLPAHRDRRNAVREKAQQVQARQVRARVLTRVSLVTLLLAMIAAAAVVVVWVVSSSAAKPTSSPANVKDDGFSVTSVTGVAAMDSAPESLDAGAATLEAAATPTPTPTAEATPAAEEATTRPSVDIRVYVDYLSTGARDFQVANVQQLSKWVNQEAATLSYYPVAMLTAKSNGTKYSLRAASAAACVATYSPDTFFAFNNELLTKQPAVDSDGFTDTELADLAIGSGATSPKAVRTCIESQKYAAWVKSATERALKGLPDTKGVALTATPMVLVNGTPYVGALDDPKEFAQFVLTIASDTYYKSVATPTPTPTATTTPAP